MWNALHNYHEKYPEDAKKEEDSRFLEQDIADRASPPSGRMGARTTDRRIRIGKRKVA